MKLIFLFAILIASSNLFACDCKVVTKEMDFQHSDYVFLGQVRSVYSSYIELFVQEIFKGENVETILVETIDDCSVHPKLGELWLIYSKKGQGNKFFVSHCGWSRSFANPYVINSENFPSPPLAGEQPDNEPAIKKALNELQSDILDLRNNKKTEPNFFAIKESYPYLMLVCVLIILGLLFFILKNRRLKM